MLYYNTLYSYQLDAKKEKALRKTLSNANITKRIQLSDVNKKQLLRSDKSEY